VQRTQINVTIALATPTRLVDHPSVLVPIEAERRFHDVVQVNTAVAPGRLIIVEKLV
jgi:hypothetical protein